MVPSTIIGPVCFRLGVCRFPISGFVLAALAVVVYGVGQGEPLEQEGPCRGFDRVLGVVIINTQYRRWTVSVWCAQKQQQRKQTRPNNTTTNKQQHSSRLFSLAYAGGQCAASSRSSAHASLVIVLVMVRALVLVFDGCATAASPRDRRLKHDGRSLPAPLLPVKVGSPDSVPPSKSGLGRFPH